MDLQNTDLILRIIIQSLFLLLLIGCSVVMFYIIFIFRSIKLRVDNIGEVIKKVGDDVTGFTSFMKIKSTEEASNKLDFFKALVKLIKKYFKF